MDFIEEKKLGTPQQRKEPTPLFDTDLFYVNSDDKYKNLTLPVASSTKRVIYDKKIKNPDGGEISLAGNFETYLWIGSLLAKPIVIRVNTYPARCKYVNSENFINKNTYNVNIPEIIYRYNDEGKLEEFNIVKEGKYDVSLPEFYDVSRADRQGVMKDYKNQEVQKTYYFVTPIVLLKEEKPKIIFISQPITTKLLKSFQDKKIIESPGIKIAAEYLFSTINNPKTKIGDPVLFFRQPNLEYRKDKFAWMGFNWLAIFNTLDDMYKKLYFDFDFQSVKSKVSTEYLSLLAARFMVDNMNDTKGNGRVYHTEDNKLDQEKSSLNSLVEFNLNSKIYRVLESLAPKKEETQKTEEFINDEEIPF